MALDLQEYFKKFPEVCKRKYGRAYNLAAMEKQFASLREGKRWLAARDVAAIFDPQNTPFARYWQAPAAKDIDKPLASARIMLTGDPAQREPLVLRLLEVFHSIAIMSLVLRMVLPKFYGVFSTPVVHLLQVNRGATGELYLAYCDELAEWAKHFGMASVADTEMALWAFAELTKAAGNDVAEGSQSFEDDIWIQRRRVAHVVRPFLRRYGRLQLARILLHEDPRLAGKIAAEEYERLLGIASKRFCRRPLDRRTGSVDKLLDELAQQNVISLHDKTDLRGIWSTRNAAVHPGGPPPSTEAIELMIDRIQSICTSWEQRTPALAESSAT